MGRRSPIFRVGPSHDIKVTPDGSLLAHISYTLNIWDLPNRTQVAKFKDVKHPAHLAISNTGHEILVKNTSGRMALYDLTTMSLVRLLTPTGCEGAKPFFSRDDQYLIDGDWDGNILVIDKSTGEIVFRKQYQSCMVHASDQLKETDTYLFVVSPKAGGTGPEAAKWGMNFVLVEWQYPFDQHKPIEHVTDWDRLWAARLSPTREYIAAVSGQELLVRERDGMTVTNRIALPRGKALAWSRDGRLLAAVGDDRVHFYEFPSLTEVHSIPLQCACTAGFPDDGESVLLGSWSSGYHMPISTALGTVQLPR